MARSKGTGVKAVAQATLTDDPDFLREIVERTLQEILETEMTALCRLRRLSAGLPGWR